MRGRVTRIESYGAFVQLEKIRGLIHISQLSTSRVERVEDIVEVGEDVWVHVTDVSTDEQGRTKVSLSLKDVNQETGTLQSTAATAVDAQSARLEQNLGAAIGMGFARDPMAHQGGLIMKHDLKGNSHLINGYALVDDTEGELPPPPAPAVEEMPPRQPLGRGRGTTLPAWMTAPPEPPPLAKKKKRKKSDGSSSREHKKRREKRKHKRHRHRSESSESVSERHHRKRRKQDEKKRRAR